MKEISTDKGWLWTVPIGGFIANFICGGFSKSFGLIVMNTKELFDSSPAPLALAGGLIYTHMYCLSILGLLVTERYGSRFAVNMGCLGCIISLLGAFFSTSVTMWVISIGFGLGTSLAFIYTPIIITLTRCFHKRIGVAIGIAVSGSCVGQMTFPYLISFIIDEFTVRSVFLFSAILCCNFFVTAVLMPRFVVLDQLGKQSNKNGQVLNDPVETVSYSKTEDFDLKTIPAESMKSTFTKTHTALLVLFIIAKVFGDNGDVGAAFALPLFAKNKIKLSNDEISLAITVSGSVDLITRLVVGIISDQTWCRRNLLLASGWLFAGFNTLFIIWFPSKIPYIVFYSIFGFTSGVAVTLMTVVLIDFIDAQNLNKGLGIMTFILGLLISPGQFLIGYINGETSNAMWFIAMILFVAFLIMTLEYPTRWIFRTKSRPLDSLDTVDSMKYRPSKALEGIHLFFVDPLERNHPSRQITFLLLSTINAKDFLPALASRKTI